MTATQSRDAGVLRAGILVITHEGAARDTHPLLAGILFRANFPILAGYAGEQCRYAPQSFVACGFRALFARLAFYGLQTKTSSVHADVPRSA